MTGSDDRLSEGMAHAPDVTFSDRRGAGTLTSALPSSATATTLGGTFALAGATEKVTAELVMRETGPLARELLIAFIDKETGKPITRFSEELTQKLHLLATDSEFSSLVHEHAGKLGSDGRFQVAMQFPKPGTYHVYADAVPTGVGQQVVRFEVTVDATTGMTVSKQAPAGEAEGYSGPYSVRFDGPLRAGTESMMGLAILKDGMPAMDLELYLGVPAHAVFVSTDDLSYVHAHAMAADASKGSHASHGVNHNLEAAIPAKLMLHATFSRAGRYALWVQFKGGGQVQTVPFFLTVPGEL